MKKYAIEFELDLFVKQIIKANTEEEAYEKAGEIISKITKKFSNRRTEVSEYTTHDWHSEEMIAKETVEANPVVEEVAEKTVDTNETFKAYSYVFQDNCFRFKHGNNIICKEVDINKDQYGKYYCSEYDVYFERFNCIERYLGDFLGFFSERNDELAINLIKAKIQTLVDIENEEIEQQNKIKDYFVDMLNYLKINKEE